MTIDIARSIGYFEDGLKVGAAGTAVTAILTGTATWATTTIAADTMESIAITVAGCQPGDPVLIGADLGPAGELLTVSGHVDVAGTVIAQVENEDTVASPDLDGVVFTAIVFRVS